MIRRYSELMCIPTFEERFQYLKLNGSIGESTFGFDRYLNQTFYRSNEWKKLRDTIIVRDMGCDLGIEDREIQGMILVHHMNPIMVEDIVYNTEYLLDPEYLICTSHNTHNAIHYGDESLLMDSVPIVRRPGDTCPWL